jgi:hypothetical protein
MPWRRLASATAFGLIFFLGTALIDHGDWLVAATIGVVAGVVYGVATHLLLDRKPR